MARQALMRRAVLAVAAAVSRRRREAISNAGPAVSRLATGADHHRGIARIAPITRFSTTATSSASRRGDEDRNLDGRGYFYDGGPVSLSDLQRRKSSSKTSSSSSTSSVLKAEDDDDEEEFVVDEDVKARRRTTTRRGLRTQRRLSEALDPPSTSALPSSSSQRSLEVDRALASAAGSLSRRPHSRSELEAKLTRRGYSSSAAREALEKLRSMGLLPSDREFSRGFARARFRSGAWAPTRIRTELVRGRGVSPEDAAAALRDVFGSESPRLFADTDDEDDEADRRRVDEGGGEEESDGGDDEGENSPSVFELSWDSISAREQSDRLLEAAERQAQLSKGLPLVARRRRLAGWMARRGHSWKTVSEVLGRVGL